MENQEPVPFGKDIPKNERDWAMFAHLSSLAGYILGAGSFNFIGPLIIWLMKREEMPFVDDQGKESLNFQITIFLGLIVSIPLVFIGVGILTAIAFWVLGLVYAILAAMKAQEGVPYRYPFALRLIN